MSLDSSTSFDSFRPSNDTNSNRISLDRNSPTGEDNNKTQLNNPATKRTSNIEESSEKDRRSSVTVVKVKKDASVPQSKPSTSASTNTQPNNDQSRRSNTGLVHVTKVIRTTPISTKVSINTASLSARHNTNVDKNVTVTKLPRVSTQTS